MSLSERRLAKIERLASRPPDMRTAESRIKKAIRWGSRRLNLRGLRLTHLPAEIEQLIFLEELNLADNHLEQFPLVLCQLTQLRKLDFYNNQIRKLPSEIASLRQLNSLSLSSNELRELPAEFGLLTDLRELDLGSNHFNGLPPAIFLLRSLENLSIDFNLGEISPRDLLRFPALKELSIAGTPLAQEVPAELRERLGSDGFKDEITVTKTTVPSAEEIASGSAWRKEADSLVIREGAMLPPHCMLTNEPVAGDPLVLRVGGPFQGAGLLLLSSLLQVPLLGLASLVVRMGLAPKAIVFHGYLSRKLLAARRQRLLLCLLLAALGTIYIFTRRFDPYLKLFFAICLWLIAIRGARQRIFFPRPMSPGLIELTRLDPDFVKQFPAWHEEISSHDLAKHWKELAENQPAD